MPAGPLPELSMPFKAGRWKAFNGPSAASRHRRAAVRIGPGKTFLMERFGIDWMRADDEARMAAGEKDNRAYLSYDTPLVAVADGVIVGTQDNIPEK